MGRGLSQIQKNILSIAYMVNAHTQGGVAALKVGNPLEGYRVPTSDYVGPPDFVTRLGVYGIYGIRPVADIIHQTQNGPISYPVSLGNYFINTPDVKAAKAAASRAVTRLTTRGMFVYRPGTKGQWRTPGYHLGPYGYLLTAIGLEIGQQYSVDIPRIDDVLRVFRVTSCSFRFHCVPGVEMLEEKDRLKLIRDLRAIPVTVKGECASTLNR